MSAHTLANVVEAVLLAAGRPMTVPQIIELFDEFERPDADTVRAALDELTLRYGDHGIELVEVASGWRIQVRARHSEIVSRLWQERPSRYSRALLETLALIAYRQPITRGEIEEIRGVTVSSTIMRTLHERNWVRVVGHREVPGRPELLGTTREFLDYFGLRSLDDLPTLEDLRDLDDIKLQLELPGEGREVQVQLAVDDDSVDDDALDSGDESSDETESTDDTPAEDASTLVAAPPSDSER